ncbi:MAG TPA: hypothetical protein VN238_09230 [Solirubrobacteraceae bacterium]|nr:hypothetical protein [Solirubrobacteraceae bacterium]
MPLPALVILGSLLLGFLTLLLPSAPTYDPFSWIIWGREILHLDLNTVDGPSWKPLPVIVTTLTAPFGEASPYIWVAVARAGAFASVILAGLLAGRLGGWVAGLVAAAGLGLMPWYIRHNALANSEGIMVALVFAGVLFHLNGRRGWAFTMAIGAGLLRPEAWPFLGLYALWLLWDDRTRLRWLALSLVSIPVLWLGPELWGSGNAFRASDRAQKPNPDSPAFAEHPALEVVKNGIDLPPVAAIVGVVLALGLGAFALRRSGTDALRDRLPARDDALTALGLGLLAVAWIGLVAVMTTRGFSGNQRYLIVPAALLILLGAVGLTWAVRALVPRGVALPAAAAVAAVALAALFVAPGADTIAGTLRTVEYQVDLYDDLGTLVEEGGGAEALKACGTAVTGPFMVPQVAWRLHQHTGQVKIEPEPGKRAVFFHVRLVANQNVGPPVDQARRYRLARAGHWLLTSDCETRR